MSLILKAATFARAKHCRQKRKGSDRPYIEHPARVAAMVCCHPLANEQRVAAAWLHDVLEDTDTTVDGLWKADFPQTTILLVQALTNAPKQPGQNRADRKRLDRERLCQVDIWAKLIKAWDRIDNLLDMPNSNAEMLGFAKSVYAQESFDLAEALEQGVIETKSELGFDLYSLTGRIRTLAIEAAGHAASLFTEGRHPLDGPPGARGL
jgi:(p)ppGpp synthase/HD superfamily hydrolase